MRRKLRHGQAEHIAKDVSVHIVEIALSSVELFATCLTCRYFDEANSFCTGYQAHPPPRIIVEACENYVDTKDTPF